VIADTLKRSAPAALRNRGPIAEVLRDWLPSAGVVLEIASGTGEHAIHFAEQFPALEWLPSDVGDDALGSIAAWRDETGLSNLRAPIRVDAKGEWPIAAADAVLCINMAHISPWSATLGLLDNAARVLPDGAALIFYGPWLADDVAIAPSNLDFDAQLRARDPRWGIRRIEDLEEEAGSRGFRLIERRVMPANNFMLLLRRIDRRR
jgi:SAM-dependent methyltransferase